MRLGRMWEYTHEGILNPDEFLVEAKDDIDKAGKRLQNYFVEKKAKTSHNTAITSVCFLRGFYVHNDVRFTKKWSTPKAIVSKVSEQDEKTSFYKYNSETDEIEFKNGNLQQFIQNLNFRDQTITLCLLSTGADARDVLNLKVGFVKDVRGKICTRNRFFWHSNRSKTAQPFKTFFSEEATEFLKRYVEQERADAKDDEFLFPTGKKNKPLDVHILSQNFRNATKNMGYAKEKEASPFRPKRFRHLFRTACAIAQVDNAFTMAFMGHASDVSASYLEQDSSIFEKIYVKIEPFLTVFGGARALVKHEVFELKGDLAKQTQKNFKMETEIEKLKEQLKSAVNYIKSLTEELELKEKAEAEEDFHKLVEEVNRENPIPEKAETKQKIKPVEDE